MSSSRIRHQIRLDYAKLLVVEKELHYYTTQLRFRIRQKKHRVKNQDKICPKPAV